MDHATPQDPTPAAKGRRKGQRASARNAAVFRHQAYTPGQLYLLRELLIEFSPYLDSEGTRLDGKREWRVSSTLPHLMEFIEYRLEKLRAEQENLDAYWRALGA